MHAVCLFPPSRSGLPLSADSHAVGRAEVPRLPCAGPLSQAAPARPRRAHQPPRPRDNRRPRRRHPQLPGQGRSQTTVRPLPAHACSFCFLSFKKIPPLNHPPTPPQPSHFFKFYFYYTTSVSVLLPCLLDLRAQLFLCVRGAAFQGGVLVVSHDQHLLSTACSELWAVHMGEVKRFPHTFARYKQDVIAGKR